MRTEMTMDGNKRPVLEPDEARAAEKTGHMRYVLGISLGLGVMFLGGLGMFFIA